MDIWAWTYQKKTQLHEAGYARLAEIMDDLPHFTCEDEHDRAESLYLEGLSLARDAGEKWVELFLRHWHLQSQVLSLRNANKLPEAISLLDFSHQEETQGCPQRICAVQDLASCYGLKDGPAYFEERVNVSLETLSEINASWPCYSCVAKELMDAYLDVEDFSTTLEQSTYRINELIKSGEEPSELYFSKARALLGLGRAEEALAAIAPAQSHGGGERFARQKKQILSLIHIALGDWEMAKEELLPLEVAMSASGYFKDWVNIRHQLFKAEQFTPTEPLLLNIMKMANILSESGAVRDTLALLGWLAEFSIAQEHRVLAEAALESMEKHIPQLVKDLGATEKHADLKRQFERLTAPKWELEESDEPESLLEREFGSANKAAITLRQAIQKWPDSPGLQARLAWIYNQLNLPEKALSMLKHARERFPDSGNIELAFARHIYSHHGLAALESECPLVDQEVSDNARLGRLWAYTDAFEESAPEKAATLIEEILHLNPESEQAHYRKAIVLEALDRHHESLPIWTRLIEKDPEDTHLHWRALVAATIAENWNLVRDAANSIGFELDKDAPLDEQKMGTVRIQFTDDNGEIQRCFAQRTGPVTATILSASHQQMTQRFAAQVVFDPSPLNELSEQDEEGNHCDAEGYYTYVYPCVYIRSAPIYRTFPLDGIHPGEAQLEILKDRLSEIEVVFSQRSSDGYRIEPEQEPSGDEEPTSLPGIYAYLLVPEQGDLACIHQCLEQFTREQPFPLIWPELLEALGDTPTLEKQVAISEKYGL